MKCGVFRIKFIKEPKRNGIDSNSVVRGHNLGGVKRLEGKVKLMIK